MTKIIPIISLFLFGQNYLFGMGVPQGEGPAGPSLMIFIIPIIAVIGVVIFNVLRKDNTPNMIKKRGLASAIILTLLTFGLYSLFWTHKIAKDVNTMCEGDGRKTSGAIKYLLLSLITVGIYGLVWLYMLGDRLQDNAAKYNLTFKEGGGTVLLWWIVGSFIVVGPFISLHILIKNTNSLANEYNKRLPVENVS